MPLNRTYLALLYYNIEKEGSYNIDSYDDRQRAERNFAKKKKVDEHILLQAYEQYLALVEKNFIEFKKTKTKN